MDGWRCEIPLLGSHKCGKLFNNKSGMYAHLSDYHASVLQYEMSITGKSMNLLLQQMADETHLGREAHQHFFCGFCDKLILQGADMQDVFDERAQHIGDHYDKKDCNVDDWVCIETNKPKRCSAEHGRPKAEQRLDGIVEEDSDLGESGIIEVVPDYKRRQALEDAGGVAEEADDIVW